MYTNFHAIPFLVIQYMVPCYMLHVPLSNGVYISFIGQTCFPPTFTLRSLFTPIMISAYPGLQFMRLVTNSALLSVIGRECES